MAIPPPGASASPTATSVRVSAIPSPTTSRRSFLRSGAGIATAGAAVAAGGGYYLLHRPARDRQLVLGHISDAMAEVERLSAGVVQPLDANASAEGALVRLRQAVQDFGAHTGPLQPHFAYGALSRAQYEQAHAMHLANHLSAFNLAAA